MTVGIVYHPIYLEHRIVHVESHERLIVLMDYLKEKNILDSPSYKLITPREASLDQIRYVHEEKLINQVKSLSQKAETTGRNQVIDAGDTLVSPKTYDASLYSVGGNLTGIDEIMAGNMSSCFAAVRPPGHHSNAFKCSGFCIFNNVAIAAEYLFREKNIKRVAIIDWDCHHGNGTSDIFFNGSPSGQGELVMFNSHQDGRTLYPGSGFLGDIGAGKGIGKMINYPMPPQSADDVIPLYFEEIISPVLEEFKPEFILVSAGFDTHWTDRLTGMGWTYQAPAMYLKLLKTIAEKHANGRILITLEGGYEAEKQAIAIYNCLKVLNDEDDLVREKERKSEENLIEYMKTKVIADLKKNLSPYWDCF